MGETTPYFSCSIVCALCGEKFTEALELTAMWEFRKHNCPHEGQLSTMNIEWITETWLAGESNG